LLLGVGRLATMKGSDIVMFHRSASDVAEAAAKQETHVPGNRALLCVPETLDLAGADQLLQRAKPLQLSCCALVVDLQRTPFIDSAGVSALLALAEQLEAEGKLLRVVVQPQSSIERVLKLFDPEGRLHVHSSLENAWTNEIPSH
jgi:anti-anti-sigma factor